MVYAAGNETQCQSVAENFTFTIGLAEGFSRSVRHEGELLVTAPRAQRRTRSIENSPAVRRQVKVVEPVDTEPHPQPRVRTLNYWQNELLAKYPLFFRAAHHFYSYAANVSYFDLKDRRGCYPTIEPLASDFETSFGLCGASNTGILRRACAGFATEVM